MRLEKWIAFAVMSGFLGANPLYAASKEEEDVAVSSATHSITREKLAHPANLRLKAGVSEHFPSSFNITGVSPHRYVSATHDEYWRLQQQEGFMFAHGIGVNSQRRLLECWYGQADVAKLLPLEMYNLAPHVALHLRHAISATLVNPAQQYTTTWYPTGLIFRVPPECLYKIHSSDAMIPMENSDTDLTEFKSRFYHPNPDKEVLSEEQLIELQKRRIEVFLGSSNEKYEQVTPTFYQERGLKMVFTYGPKEAIMPYQHPTKPENGLKPHLDYFHEAAFSPYVVKDRKIYSVEIVGVFIGNGGKYSTDPVKREETSTWKKISAQYDKNGQDKKNLWYEMEESDKGNLWKEMSKMEEEREREYVDAAQKMAKTLGVPLYDWRKKSKDK